MVGVMACLMASGVSAQNFAIEEATIAGIRQALQTKAVTCRQIVQAYLDRIAAYDRKGPALNSILTLNPKALEEADRLDSELSKGAAMGPLHCAPLLLKDNYNTADLPTTGGSAALAGMQPQADAFAVAKLRKAGAMVVGVSLDDVKSHADFAAKYHVPFPLLADSDKQVATAYGVLTSKMGMQYAKRTTFLIDPEGKVAKVYQDVDPEKNSAQVQSDLTTLKSSDKASS